jgi:radical SAM-linked protein
LRNVRIWFKKIGSARYISHLDLSRCMARALRRAKIPLWYTQGYNPHAFLTFALPLSLGIGGERESMDIRLDDDTITREEMIERLNKVLPKDIPVFDVTEPVMKPGQITYAEYTIFFDTGDKDPEETAEQIKSLFQSAEVVVPKHTKSGIINLDIRPYLDRVEVKAKEGGVELQAMLPAGSTFNINPSLLNDAIKKYLNLDFYANILRKNLYDENFKIFK